MRRNLFHCSNSQQGATDKVTLLFGITIFFKFLLFDFIWSIPTTFASFSTIEFYATKIIATLVLLVPYKFFRLWKTEIVIMLLLDILLIVNLMYFRTYYTAIPLNSYGLSGNLADFTGSVYDSFRWYDIFFPLSTIASIPLYWHYKRNTAGSRLNFLRNRYLAASTPRVEMLSNFAISFVGIFKRSNAQKRKSPEVKSVY